MKQSIASTVLLTLFVWLSVVSLGVCGLSCASSSCHNNSVASAPIWNRSYALWYSKDPHAQAGRLLDDPDARQIVIRLDGRAETDSIAFDNVLRQRCISCHATASKGDCQPSDESLSRVLLAAGVACDACHGDSSSWEFLHMREGWSDPSGSMRETKSIVGRATTCSRCHIGSKVDDDLDRDVGHDLIAAGHPALRFDFLINHDNLPKHWIEEDSFPNSSVRVRRIGRLVALRAAAELARQRTLPIATGIEISDQRALVRGKAAALVRASQEQFKPAAWPDFAEYDCFACHQRLASPAWLDRTKSITAWRERTANDDSLRLWNAFFTAQLVPARTEFAWMNSAPSTAIASTARTFEQKVALERLARLIEWSNSQLAQLNGLSDSELQARTNKFMDTLRSRIQNAESRIGRNWHEAAVTYLEIDAACRDLVAKTPDADLQAALATLESTLRFQSKHIVPNRRYHSPVAFHHDEFTAAIREVLIHYDRLVETDRNTKSPTRSVETN